MSPSRFCRALSWSPSVALSWMWGLGFFYSMHVVWVQGWAGFWVFAVSNACGLALFGCVLNSARRDPETTFERLRSRFLSLFLACQVGAVAITLYCLHAYLWSVLIPAAGSGTALALSALIVTVACATGHSLSLSRLRLLHVVYAAIAVVAIVLAWMFMPVATVLKAAVDAPSPSSLWPFVIPTLVGFALGPWGDIQQWQRAIEIRRSGVSLAVAYIGGGLLFLMLLTANAVLSRSAGMSLTVGSDGALGAQTSVAVRFATDGAGLGMVAFAIWASIAAISTIDSFYCATRWYLGSLTSKSLHPALAFVSPATVASPLWLLAVACVAAYAMSSFGLSQVAYMMPYATLLVAATLCLVAECVRAPGKFDAVDCYLVGLAGGIVFFIGYREDIAVLIPLSTVVASLAAIGPMRALIFDGSQQPAWPVTAPPHAGGSAVDGTSRVTLPETASAHEPETLHAQNSNMSQSHGFEGQWFVMRVVPTYDDTNSVGNVYFANYVRWVGKARELFFNACMPNFDLETTRYYVLTRSFQHDFRREIDEFEPAKIRIRIAAHNRKFVTLAHEIVSDRHGLLGRGEQSLMFVDRSSFKPLDIPVDIVRGFLPFWPSSKSGSEARTDRRGRAAAG